MKIRTAVDILFHADTQTDTQTDMTKQMTGLLFSDCVLKGTQSGQAIELEGTCSLPNSGQSSCAQTLFRLEAKCALNKGAWIA